MNTNHNVIADGIPPRHIGVIDFERAHLEVPLADIGHMRAAHAQGRRGGRPAAVIGDPLAIARACRERGEPVTKIDRHLHVG